MADYTLSASITGDSSSFQRACASASSSVSSFEKKTSSVGNAISNAGKTITSFGNKLTSCITKPAVAAGTALGTVVLAKGWARMTEIDDAKAKLTALGHSTEEVSEIMANANDAVTGTSYSLAEAATTAASAVAAGIQPGKDLTQYLGSVADTAAIAGTSMEDMGSIFNQVATNGKATNRVLQELANQGIPIYQYLAEECGVTEDAIFDMASNGEISLEMFRTAIEDNLSGAAEVIGSTTITGAIENIGASISRIGANFLGSADDANTFAGQLLPLLNDFKSKLGDVEAKASEWGALFGEVFSGVVDYVKTGGDSFDQLSDKAQNIVNKITPIIDVVENIGSAFSSMSGTAQAALVGGAVAAGPLISAFGKVTSAVGGAVSAVGKISGALGTASSAASSAGSATSGLSGIFSALSSPIGIVVAAITGLVAAFVYLMATNDDFRGSIMDSVSTIGGALAPVLESIGTQIGNLASAVIPAVLNVVNQLAPVLSQIVSVAASIIAAVSPIATMLINSIIPAVTQIVTAVVDFVSSAAQPALNVIQNILSVIQTVIPVIQNIISVIVEVASNIISTLADIISGVISFASDFISNMTDAASGVLSGVVGFISQLPGKIATFLSNILSNAISWGTNIVNNMRNAASNAINGVITFFQQLPGKVQTFLSNVISKVLSWASNLLSNMKSAASKAVSGAVEKVKELPEKFKSAIDKVYSKISSWGSSVLSAFKSAIQGVVNSALGWGKDIISNFTSGITSGISKIKDACSNIASSVKNLLHFSVPDEGPLADADTWMPDFMDLLASGISQNEDAVVREVKEMANAVADAASLGAITADVQMDSSGLVPLSDSIPQEVDYAVSAVNANQEPIDMSSLLEGVVIQIINNTNVDGTPLKEMAADYTIKKISNQQRSAMRSRGA